MEKEQFDEIREFARGLNAKRQLMSDGALLDQCQQHLNALVEHLADEFEEAPHINEESLERLKVFNEAAREHLEPPPEPAPFTPPATRPEPLHEVHQHSSHQPQHHKKGPTKKHR